MQQKASSLPPRPPDQGLCPWTPLGAQPQTPNIFPPSKLAIPFPNLGCLDKTLSDRGAQNVE